MSSCTLRRDEYMDLDAAPLNILKEERAGGLPRHGSLAARRRSLRARGVDQTKFLPCMEAWVSVLPHAAENFSALQGGVGSLTHAPEATAVDHINCEGDTRVPCSPRIDEKAKDP